MTRLLYAGTPEFAVPALEALLRAGYAVAAVYTQPDRPAGRGRQVQASPVKQCALQAGVPVRQPVTLKDPAVWAEFAAWQADALIVAAYGLILPLPVLQATRRGGINLHASLLPRWRGAAPVARALQAGDVETGITLMQMAEGLDTGAILAQAALPIGPAVTAGTLQTQLAYLGAELLLAQLPALLEGRLAGQPQDEAQVTYAAKLRKDEAALDWMQPAEVLARQVRALYPWPVASTGLAGQILRVGAAQVGIALAQAAPGTVQALGPTGPEIACGQGVLCLQQVQLPGKRMIAATDLVRQPAPGGKGWVGLRLETRTHA